MGSEGSVRFENVFCLRPRHAKRGVTLTAHQLNLLTVNEGQVLIVDLRDAVDTSPCRHHESKLANHCRHDSHIALPLEDVADADPTKDERIHNRIDPKKDQTQGDREGRPREE